MGRARLNLLGVNDMKGIPPEVTSTRDTTLHATTQDSLRRVVLKCPYSKVGNVQHALDRSLQLHRVGHTKSHGVLAAAPPVYVMVHRRAVRPRVPPTAAR